MRRKKSAQPSDGASKPSAEAIAAHSGYQAVMKKLEDNPASGRHIREVVAKYLSDWAKEHAASNHPLIREMVESAKTAAYFGEQATLQPNEDSRMAAMFWIGVATTFPTSELTGVMAEAANQTRRNLDAGREKARTAKATASEALCRQAERAIAEAEQELRDEGRPPERMRDAVLRRAAKKIPSPRNPTKPISVRSLRRRLKNS